MNRPLVLALALATCAATTAVAQPGAVQPRCTIQPKVPTCSQWSVAADRLLADHHGYASDGALVVRRGSAVRARLTVQNPATCGEPGLLLKDLFSGYTMQVPFLTKADGLAVALATRQALAAGDPKQAELVAASLDRTLGGTLGGTLEGGEAASKFADLAALYGTPYFATALDVQKAPQQGQSSVDVALWLPENMPIGAYTVTATCSGTPDSSALPLAVLFNPYDATAPEFLADESARKASLAGSAADAQAGPLDLPFSVAGANARGGELALRAASILPNSVRAVPALVSLALQQSLLNAAKADPPDRYFDRARRVVLWEARKAQLWNDATGHFDLWDGAAMRTTEGAPQVLSGRWAPADARLVVAGVRTVSLLGADTAKGLQPGFLFGLQDTTTTVAIQASHLPSALQPFAKKAIAFGQGGAALLFGSPTFTGDYLGGGTLTPIDDAVPFTINASLESAVANPGIGFLTGKLSCDQDKACAQGVASGSWASSDAFATALLTGSKPRVRYGQCWVFAGALASTARSIGIPTRPVTNFDSAHESKLPAGVGPANRGLASAVKYRSDEVRAGGDEPGLAVWNFDRWASAVKAAGGNPDSIWNFHVWTEAMWAGKQGTAIWNFHVWDQGWVQSKQGEPANWNAYDATPQELSDPVYEGGVWSLAKTALGFSTPAILIDSIAGKWLAP